MTLCPTLDPSRIVLGRTMCMWARHIYAEQRQLHHREPLLELPARNAVSRPECSIGISHKKRWPEWGRFRSEETVFSCFLSIFSYCFFSQKRIELERKKLGP